MTAHRSDAELPRHRRHFGLRDLFAWLTALAIALGIFVQVPRPTLQPAISMAPALIVCTVVFALWPLTCINLIAAPVAAFLTNPSQPPLRRPLRWWIPHRLLLQAGAVEPPSWPVALLLAFTTTLVLAALWPLLREIGLALAVWWSSGRAEGWRLLEDIPNLMVNRSFLWRLFSWELWSIARWWLLFGTWTTAWLVVAAPLRKHWQLESGSTTCRRFLAFAPWLVVLEIAFLVGVWTKSTTTVPEPSTGFVEGIFSWDLWHWDCWLGQTWINRGLLPTWIAATIFARYVLRWRWPAALAVAACLVPPALMLSVAWSVLW